MTEAPSLAALPSPGIAAGTLAGTIDAGGVAGSETVDPYQGATIDAIGPDGSTYRLVLEPGSVRRPTVVSLRPISSISIAGAELLAGVEIEPSGLQLFAPAALTIIPATVSAATPTALEYSGSSGSAIARIAATTITSSTAAYELVLAHFSGGIVTSLNPDTETTLFEAFAASHDLPNTPEGRQAKAETGLRTIKWAEEHGRLDHDSASQRTAEYTREWWDAEADRVRDEPALADKIKGGDPADADAVSAEVSRMLEAAKRVQDSGVDATPTQIEALGLIAEYGKNLVEYLKSDTAFQAKLESGLVSNMDDVIDSMGLVARFARDAALAGHEDIAATMQAAWMEFLQKFSVALGGSCSEAPITATTALTLSRQAALLGLAGALDALQACLPTVPPCPTGRQPAGVPLLARRSVHGAAAAGSCVPATVTGTLTVNAKQLHDAVYPDGYVTASYSATIQIRLSYSATMGNVVEYQDAGSTLSYSQDVTSPGSDPLCNFESHASASGTFAANHGSLGAEYQTDTSGSEHLDLWISFKAPIKFLFHGCGADESGLAEISGFGCDQKDPVRGVPVASSASGGRIIDFSCTDDAFVPEEGEVWQMQNSGTVVLGP